MTGDSDKLFAKMQRDAFDRGMAPPVVNQAWWEISATVRRLRADLAGFLKEAEKAEQGEEPPSDYIIAHDMRSISSDYDALMTLLQAEIQRREGGGPGAA